MGSAIPEIPEEFKSLSIDERIAYVQALWDFIAQSSEDIPVPEWHRQVLEERLARWRENPAEGKTWEEVKEIILGKLRDS